MIGMTSRFPGNVSDIDIFKKHLAWLFRAVQNVGDEAHGDDISELEDTFPRQWALLEKNPY